MRSQSPKPSGRTLGTVHLRGTVCSGRGLASGHLLPARQNLENCLGSAPFTGTLNITTSKPWLLNRQTARVIDTDHRMVWPARVSDEPVLIYRWPGCPLHVIELVSTTRLRTLFQLRDGDPLVVQLPTEHCATISRHAQIAWALLWGLGRKNYYHSRGRYPAHAEALGRHLGAGQ